MSAFGGQKRDFAHTFDVELEQTLLGSILVNPSLVVPAAAALRGEDFYEGLHQAIFELMLEQQEAGTPITPPTLITWLRHDPRFEDLGGASNYLTELALGAPAAAQTKGSDLMIEQVAKDLAGYAARRRGVNAIDDARTELLQGKSITAALADVVVVADELAAREAEGHHGRQAGHITHTLLRDIESQAVSELAYACKTGIDELDEIIGGLVPGNFIVIGGRPGMGKTLVGAKLCLAACAQDWEPDYWSLEMPGRELGARMVSALDYEHAVLNGRKPLHYDRLIQLRATSAELTRAAWINSEQISTLPLEIFDFEDVTMARIGAICRARAAKAARRGKRKLFIVDHMHLIEPDDRYRGRKVDELALITKRGKQLAKKTGCPFVMLCQLNREVEGREDKRPRISDFRDSGSIEQDADVLVGLYRHDYYAAQKLREAKGRGANNQSNAEAEQMRLNGTLELEVLKNRNGRTATAKCHAHVASGAICNEEPAKKRVGDLYSDLTGNSPPLAAYADETSRGAP